MPSTQSQTCCIHLTCGTRPSCGFGTASAAPEFPAHHAVWPLLCSGTKNLCLKPFAELARHVNAGCCCTDKGRHQSMLRSTFACCSRGADFYQFGIPASITDMLEGPWMAYVWYVWYTYSAASRPAGPSACSIRRRGRRGTKHHK